MWTKRIGGWLALGAAFGAAACSSGEGQEIDTAEQALTRSTPYRVKALDYSNFKDNDSIHEGNCGSGAVDAETTSDPSGGGCNVGWTKAGEWLEYTLQTASATKVNFVARVASANSGKTFRLLLDNVDISGSLTVPNSGWQAFADRVVKDVSLSAGTHTLRVSFETGDTNLNYIDVTPAAVALPARIEAEDYQRSYESTPTQKSGNGCDRGDGVDKELTGDSAGGNCNIGWTTAGEWLEYDVSVSQAGAYTIKARAGTGVDGRTLRLSVDGTDVATLAVPKTSWTSFQDVVFANVNLSAGTHTVRVTFPQGDTNLNYLDFVAPPAPTVVSASSTGESLGAAAAYNAFVFQDLSVTPSIAGPVAAGRDISASSFGYNTSSAGEIGAVVGRNFAGSNGSVRQDLVYGNTASLTNVGILDGVSKQGSPIDFVAEKANLDALESNLASLPTNGTTSVQPYATIDFVGTHPALNVFTVEGSKLGSTDSLNFSVPSTSTVVVNVSGSSAVFETTGMQLNGLTPGHLLWNFRDASSIRIALTGFKGTLLATNAAVTQSSSQLEGSLIASSLTGGDNGLLWKPFDGQFPWTPADPSGATAGSLTIRGQIKDADGNRVVGARVDLQGAAQAVRYTDFSGSYVFHVNPGSYSVWASGACSITPTSANLGSVSANVVRDFSSSGSNCVTAKPSYVSATGQILDLKRGSQKLGRTQVQVRQRESSAAALERLASVAAEQAGSKTLTILGNSAVERQIEMPATKVYLPQDLSELRPKKTAITTAIASGDRLVRFETQLAADVDKTTVDRVFSAGRNFDGLTEVVLHDLPRTPGTLVQHSRSSPGDLPILTAPSSVAQVNGEVQVAVSDASGAMVIGTSRGPYFSTNAGRSVGASTWTTVVPPGATVTDFRGAGDPSVAVGAPDATGRQAFYLTYLVTAIPGTPGGPGEPPTTPTVAAGLFTSTDNGGSFSPAANPWPINCADSSAGCVVPDQVQLAVDRRNRGVGADGFDHDQLYLAWRHYTSSSQSLMFACSADGGSTWTFNGDAITWTGSDFPRLTVSPDGSLLVVYGAFSREHENQYTLLVDKFSPCIAGFVPDGYFPRSIDTAQNPAELAGMPRQPIANYSIAVSDADVTGNTVFVAYSSANDANDASDVIVARSTDGGREFPSQQVVNRASAGHRYFPSICTTRANAFVSWYDRRAGGDLTAYYRSSLSDSGVLGDEFNVSGDGREDPQCLTGFPGTGATTPQAELACTNLPNVVFGIGRCDLCAEDEAGPCGGSLANCDYRAGVPNTCASGETCHPPSGAVAPGSPKYGDYASQGCGAGRVFMAWASGTPPLGACTNNGSSCAAATECCSGYCVNGACAPSAAACVATGGACSSDGQCCGGTCQGGQCFTPVQVYASSTSCTGNSAFFDPTCGPGEFKVSISATIGQTSGPRVCGKGSGFTPHGRVLIAYDDTPFGQEPVNHFVGTADEWGNVSFTDSSQQSPAIHCTQEQHFLDPKVIVTDEATGRTLEDVGTIYACMWCIDGLCPTNANGGCN